MNLTKKISNRLAMMSADVRCRYARSMLGRDFIEYGGKKMLISGDGDLQEKIYHANFQNYYRNERDALAKFVKPGDVVADVGSNVGFMAIIFSELVGETGAVHCFEPVLGTYRKLLRTISINQLSNVFPHNIGCGRSAEQLSIDLSAVSSGLFSLHTDSGANAMGAETIKIEPLDAVEPLAGARLALIKIDTEGHDDQVLLGAERTIRHSKPFIYIEMGAMYPDSSARSVDILRRCGYNCSRDVALPTTAEGWRSSSLTEDYMWHPG